VNKKVLIIAGAVIVVLFLGILIIKGLSPQTASQKSSPAAKELYAQAVSARKNHELFKAKELYQQIVTEYPDIENIATVQDEMETLSMEMIFSKTEIPEKTVIHEVIVGDSLAKIAKKYGTTVDLIKASNNLKADVIQVGQKLRIWTGIFNVLVDKSQNILILKDGNDIVKVYNVSTGLNNSTPVGTFKITTKLVDPVWFSRGVVVPPESPQNVLGSRWLGFDLPGYGIHGTIEPETIGKQVTAGCVRMRNADVEELYGMLPMGTEVVVVD
jgi:lipoprotein-anchoring transpeptidase ErfK/SrfK